MDSYYVYLLSSLSMPRFGAPPPFSFEKFLEVCRRFIPEKDVEMLKITKDAPPYTYAGSQPALKRWFAFDTALRNELVKIRAGRRQADAAQYLRPDGYTGPSPMHTALSAHRAPSVLDAERILDEARWSALDEICAGHYFDLDALIVYALKLLILERWESINTADRVLCLEGALRFETSSHV